MLSQHQNLVVWNPSSGVAGEMMHFRRQLEDSREFDVVEPGSREATVKVIQSRAKDYRCIVAAGGDGTVNSVAEGIVRSHADTVLAVLPMGSGNDFARTLGIPLASSAALDVVENGEVHHVDIFHCRTSDVDRLGFNMVTGGNSGRMSELMSPEVKKKWGQFCYLRAVINLIGDLERYDVTITIDGVKEHHRLLNLFIANGRTSGGGITVAVDAKIDDGRADVFMVHAGGAGEIADLTAEFLLADYREHPLVEFRRAQSIRIDSSQQMWFTIDGDEVGSTPVEVEVLPRKLAVLVPRE